MFSFDQLWKVPWMSRKLVLWLLVGMGGIQCIHMYIYIYIHIYRCVCMCMICVYDMCVCLCIWVIITRGPTKLGWSSKDDNCPIIVPLGPWTQWRNILLIGNVGKQLPTMGIQPIKIICLCTGNSLNVCLCVSASARVLSKCVYIYIYIYIYIYVPGNKIHT